jgi:RimJ/RimL family protein N-acetyltransferase
VALNGSHESARLAYEELRTEHAVALFPALSDPRVHRHLTGKPPATADDLADEFARMTAGPSSSSAHERWLNYVVQLKTEDRLIGRLEAAITRNWAEVAYLFDPQHWGCGYATEAMLWLHDYLHREWSVSESWATVHPNNERSIQLLLRIGYQRSDLDPLKPLASYDPGDFVFRNMGLTQGK